MEKYRIRCSSVGGVVSTKDPRREERKDDSEPETMRCYFGRLEKNIGALSKRDLLIGSPRKSIPKLSRRREGGGMKIC